MFMCSMCAMTNMEPIELDKSPLPFDSLIDFDDLIDEGDFLDQITIPPQEDCLTVISDVE